MELTAKLQIRPGQRVAAIAVPDGVVLAGVEEGEPGTAEVVIAFVRHAAELDTAAVPAIKAALADRTAWIAYPKAGKLGTDLNRDVLARLVSEHGVRPVRQVAIDDTWSALRFRPA